MEGFGGFFNDPDFQKRLADMAEQMQGAQNIAWADNAIKLAVDMTVAAMNRLNVQGTPEQQAQQLRQVMAKLETLSDDRREALIMRFALGMDNREIARALGRSDGATKVLIHRAIKQLQEEMGDDS